MLGRCALRAIMFRVSRKHVVEIIQPSSNLRTALTYSRRWGCNALVVLEFAFVLAPLLMGIAVGSDMSGGGTPQGISQIARVMLPICAIVAAVFDILWRWRNEPDPRWWVKLVSADAGAAL